MQGLNYCPLYLSPELLQYGHRRTAGRRTHPPPRAGKSFTVRNDHSKKPQGHSTLPKLLSMDKMRSPLSERPCYVCPWGRIKPVDATSRASSLFSLLWRPREGLLWLLWHLRPQGQKQPINRLLSISISGLLFPPTLFSRVNCCEAVAIYSLSENREYVQIVWEWGLAELKKNFRFLIPISFWMAWYLSFCPGANSDLRNHQRNIGYIIQTWGHCPFNF